MPKFTYDYPRPAVTVDLLLFAWIEPELALLLIRRKAAPYAGRWALPGGFINMDEGLAEAARRECGEETGIEPRQLSQLGAFGAPDRDPRQRTITVAYYGLLPPGAAAPRGGDDAREARWFPVTALPPLAFDHGELVGAGLRCIREKGEDFHFGLDLLPDPFTLAEAQRVYDALLGRTLDKRNFRKKMMALEMLRPAQSKRGAGARTGQYFQFDRGAQNRWRRGVARREISG